MISTHERRENKAKLQFKFSTEIESIYRNINGQDMDREEEE